MLKSDKMGTLPMTPFQQRLRTDDQCRERAAIECLQQTKARTSAAASLLVILIMMVSPSAMAMTTTCPSTFDLVSSNDTSIRCDFMGMISDAVPGTPPTQTAEGRRLVIEASNVCRAMQSGGTVGTVIGGGPVGDTGVVVECQIPLNDEEIAALQAPEPEDQTAEIEEPQQIQEPQVPQEPQGPTEEELAAIAAAEAAAQEQRERDAPLTFDQPPELVGRNAESAVATSLVSVCESLRDLDQRNAAQNDLLERCIDINREDSGTQKVFALGEIAAKQYSDIGQSLTFLNTIQVGNIGGRLAAITPTLRQNAKDVASYDTSHPDQGLLAGSSTQIGGAAGDNNGGRFGVFVLGTRGDGDKDASELSRGFDYRSNSMTMGIDYMLSPSAVIGLAFGEGRTDSEFTGGTGSLDIDSKTVTLYGAKALKDFFTLDGMIGLGDVQTDSIRRMNFIVHGNQVDQSANSRIDSDQKIASIGLSKSFERWLTVDLGARYNYVETDIGRFSEEIDASQPGFGLALEIDDYQLKSSTVDLSVSLSKAFSTHWGVIIPQARLNWIHEFESGDRQLFGRFLADTSSFDFSDSGVQVGGGLGSNIFSVPLERLDADYGNLLLGVNLLFPHQISVNASINRTLGITGFDHSYWSLSARKDF